MDCCIQGILGFDFFFNLKFWFYSALRLPNFMEISDIHHCVSVRDAEWSTGGVGGTFPGSVPAAHERQLQTPWLLREGPRCWGIKLQLATSVFRHSEEMSEISFSSSKCMSCR